MSIKTTIIKGLENKDVARFGKTAAGAVVATTILKAVGRPAFIMADKKTDAEAKKYTATKEFLYQTLCLLIALGMMPLFEKGGYKLAQKQLGMISEKLAGKTKITEVAGLENITNMDTFKKSFLDMKFEDKVNFTDEQEKAINFVNGGIELGSFVGSILGLTIVAPLISHKILHPIMNAMGMEKGHHGHDQDVAKQAPSAEAKKVNVSA